MTHILILIAMLIMLGCSTGERHPPDCEYNADNPVMGCPDEWGGVHHERFWKDKR